MQATLADLPQSTCEEEQWRSALACLTHSGTIELRKVQYVTSLIIDINHKIHLATLLITDAMPILLDGQSPRRSESTSSSVQQARLAKTQRRCNFCLMIFDPGMLGVTLKFNTTLAVSAA